MAISYTLKHSKRARSMRLSVQPGGSVVLTVPAQVPQSIVEDFIQKHTTWIQKTTLKMRNFTQLPHSRAAYLNHKEEARDFITARIAYWNMYYGFHHNRIAIKNTRGLWGSCSRKGNLNFSFALVFLPRELADYVVVHELCHLQEHNHGENFWRLVERTMPSHARHRLLLRKYLLK